MKNIRNLAILLASILTFASANAEIKSNTNKKETIKTVVESGKKSEKATASQLKKEEEKKAKEKAKQEKKLKKLHQLKNNKNCYHKLNDSSFLLFVYFQLFF